MNKIKILLGSIFIASACCTARAASYGEGNTHWNTFTGVGITNVTGIATNISATAVGSAYVDCRQSDGFTLQFTLAFTNACAGTYDVQWTSSADGVAYVASPAVPGASGWFSIPLTNGGTTVTWVTNVPMSTRGFWKFNWGTNQAGQSLTNAVVKAYIKPKRTAQDF